MHKKGVASTLYGLQPLDFIWLGDLDSNQDSRSQSPLSYH
jgi:hypothetical protein